MEDGDFKFLTLIQNYDNKYVGTILNRVSPEFLESLTGEIKKERSKMRILIKNILKRKLSFKSETKINFGGV